MPKWLLLQGRNLEERLAAAGCSKKSMYLWARGTTVPRVETLFQLCFQLDLRPVDLLREARGVSSAEATQAQVGGGRGEMPSEGVAFPATVRDTPADTNLGSGVIAVEPDTLQITEPDQKPPRQQRTPISEAKSKNRVTYEPTARRNQIKKQLEEALSMEPPPSLHEVAASLRMSSSTRLREIEPELSSRLTHVNQIWNGRQDAAIRAIFDKPFDPEEPLSLERFCKRHGISYWVVRRKDPDLRNAYFSRFQALRKKAKEVRANARAIAVAEAVDKIRWRGE
jgi:hypothetical protein